MELFLMFKVSFEKFPEQCYQFVLQCQIDLIVVTFNCVPLLVFVTIWFAVSIRFGCCSVKPSFSARICHTEKTSEKFRCSSKIGFVLCSIKISELEPCWIFNGFCCVFSVGFVFGSTDGWFWVDSVSISVLLLLSKNFVFRWSFWVWFNSFVSTWHCGFIVFSEDLVTFEDGEVR